MVASIESRRRRRTSSNALPGFAEGGYSGAALSGSDVSGLLDRILKTLERNNDRPVKTYVALTDLEAQQSLRRRFKKTTSLSKE